MSDPVYARGMRVRRKVLGDEHVCAAVRNGLTVDEIKEVLLQSAIYCGVPAANSAFAIAQRVLADLDARTPGLQQGQQE